jgi:hypothetical protein
VWQDSVQRFAIRILLLNSGESVHDASIVQAAFAASCHAQRCFFLFKPPPQLRGRHHFIRGFRSTDETQSFVSMRAHRSLPATEHPLPPMPGVPFDTRLTITMRSIRAQAVLVEVAAAALG